MFTLAIAACLAGQYCPTGRPYVAPSYASYGYQPTYQPTYQYAAPAYVAPTYAAPQYPLADKLYLGYANPYYYSGYMAQHTRQVEAEKEREDLKTQLAEIRGYLRGSASGGPQQTAPPVSAPVAAPPPEPLIVPPKSPDATFGAPPPPPLAGVPGTPQPAIPFGAAPPPPPIQAGGAGTVKPPPPAALLVYRSRCSKCHTGDADGGGGFAMFTADGNPAPLTPLDLDLIEKRVRGGTMPPRFPGGRLPADERAAVSQHADENALAIARALATARQASR